MKTTVILFSSIFFLFAHSLFAEINESANTPKTNSTQDDDLSYYEQSLVKALKKSEDTIMSYSLIIEKLHLKLSTYSDVFKEEIKIINEDHKTAFENNEKMSYLKFTRFIFDGDKLKEIQLISRKKFYTNEDWNEFKTLHFYPTDSRTSLMIVESTDSNTKKAVNTFTLESKVRLMRSLETIINNSIMRMDMLIKRMEAVKINKEIQRITF